MKNTINIADTMLGYKLARINLAFSFEGKSCYWNILRQASQVLACSSGSGFESIVSVKVNVKLKPETCFQYLTCIQVITKYITLVKTKIFCMT